jgi:hypothetical protein
MDVGGRGRFAQDAEVMSDAARDDVCAGCV